MKKTAGIFLMSLSLLSFACLSHALPIAEMEQVSPNPLTYQLNIDFYPFQYTGIGDVTSQLEGVDLNPLLFAGGSDSGCQASDFAGFTSGNIAFMHRGSCLFRDKVQNAINAGAIGAIVFNRSVPGDALVNVTLSLPAMTIPSVFTTLALGTDLFNLMDTGNDVMLHLLVRTDPSTIPPSIPEPSTLILLGSGLVGLGMFRKKFKK